ncbi:MAG TPA: fluoride efflux transporter CrcB [Dysgonamonadaceae bacterium]|nr:fluoride efflux transporter CrcB [Dysgonamonadaceae bacterium]
MFKDILFVGIGGGIGSIMRFLTSRFMARLVAAQWLFLGTLAANLIGCFLIGILSGWMLSHMPDNQPFRLLFIVGFCGGYTTFSTFAFENYRLIEMSQWGILLLYLLASVVLGIIAVWLGMKIVS